jgi:ABC-type transport system involved in multi-copper enzyme maturation permease subunit
MGMRLGAGPVFIYESLINARRWQVYAARSFFVLLLLLGMTITWIAHTRAAFRPGGRAPTIREMAEVGRGFFYALTGVQVSLILLAAPASTAGAFGSDRARGTLLHLFVTDLSDAEIVLGTLGARLAPIFGLIVGGVPVMALAALLGGIDFGALVGAFALSMALAVLGCTLALTLSVRVPKTHEVLMAVYVAEGLWLFALPIWWSLSRGRPPGPPLWFRLANPYVIAFAPYNKPGTVGVLEFAAFAGGVLALSALLLGWSIVRLRRVVIAQSAAAEGRARPRRVPALLKRIFPSWPSPTLDGNPVLWREWHRSRPLRLERWLWAGLMAVTWSLAAWGTVTSINAGIADGSREFDNAILIHVALGMLLLGATAPTAMAEERVRGSLDVLMVSPLSTRAIVAAKWWGMFRRVLVLVPLPMYVAVFVAAAIPETVTLPRRLYLQPVPLTAWDRILAATLCPADFLASGALIVSLGLALAIWVRRLGRAVALSVILFFLIGIGWIILVALCFEFLRASLPRLGIPWLNANPRWLGETLMALSPIAGPPLAIDTLKWYAGDARPWRWAGLGVVITIKAVAAWLLLWLSIKTFDRRMGRVPEARAHRE